MNLLVIDHLIIKICQNSGRLCNVLYMSNRKAGTCKYLELLLTKYSYINHMVIDLLWKFIIWGDKTESKLCKASKWRVVSENKTVVDYLCELRTCHEEGLADMCSYVLVWNKLKDISCAWTLTLFGLNVGAVVVQLVEQSLFTFHLFVILPSLSASSLSSSQIKSMVWLYFLNKCQH